MKTDDEVQFLKAVWFGEIEKVKKFLDREVYPDLDVNFEKMSNTDGMVTALDIAASLGREEILGLLLKDPRVSKKPNKDGRTALRLAVSYRQDKACEMLIPHCSILAGGDSLKPAYYLSKDRILSAKTKEEKDKSNAIENMLKVPTFVTASRVGNLKVVKDLVKDGVDVNGMFGEGSSLMVAAINGQEEVVDYLLTLPKVDVNQKGSNGVHSILHLLSRVNSDAKLPPYTIGKGTIQSRIAQKLINAGANINAIETQGGATPLRIAAAFRRMDIVEVLIKNNADITIKYSLSDGSKADIVKLTFFCRPEIYLYIKDNYHDKKNFNSMEKATISSLYSKFSAITDATSKPDEFDEEISASVKNPC